MSEIKASRSIGNPPNRRKLIAVAYLDMVGYSRWIGLDGTGTLERLRSLRRNVIDPATEEHGGTLVQTGGDWRNYQRTPSGGGQSRSGGRRRQ